MVRLALIAFVYVGTGCVDGFRGSNVQIDLSPATAAQASQGATPSATQLPANSSYKLFAIQRTVDRDRLFELQQFEVHMIVDLTSPCFIDVGAHVPHPGLHVSQFATKISEDTGIPDFRNPPATATEKQKIDATTAAQRMINIAALGGPMGMKAVTSASTSTYGGVAADCTDTSKIPPPMCTDDDSNARRLAMCQAAWDADPALWEGTDRVFTTPLAGTTFGMVDGLNPINSAPVGGAPFFVNASLENIDAFALYAVPDGGDGTLVLYGLATEATVTRGVRHVSLTSQSNPALSAQLAIISDLDEDSVHF